MVYFIKGIAVSSVSKCLQKDEHKKFRTQAQNNRRHLLSASQPFQRGFQNPFTENSVSPPHRNKVLWRPYCHAQIRKSFSPGKPNLDEGTLTTVFSFCCRLFLNVCYAAVNEAGCFSQLKRPIWDFRVECLNCPQVLGLSILNSEVYITEEKVIWWGRNALCTQGREVHRYNNGSSATRSFSDGLPGGCLYKDATHSPHLLQS